MSIKGKVRELCGVGELEKQVASMAGDVKDLESHAVGECARMDRVEKTVNQLRDWSVKSADYDGRLKEQLEKFIKEVTLNTSVLQEEINALMNAHWWQLITKKQKAAVLGTAIVRAREKAQKGGRN